MKEVQISLPEAEFNKLEKRGKEKGFNSASDYILDLIMQIASKIEEKDKNKLNLSEEEKRKIKEKLVGLGYIDQSELL